MKQLLFLAFLLTPQLSPAQHKSFRPKAILIELFTRGESIEYLNNHNQPEKARQMVRDCAGIRAAIIRDWRDHFHFCPVYYFYDTCAGKIRDRQLAGCLLNSDLQPVEINHDLQDGNYFIGYVGTVTRDSNHTQNSLSPMMVLNDADFKLLRSPVLASSAQPDPINIWYTLFPSRYSYLSRFFNLDYYPTAGKYQRKIEAYFQE